MRECSLHGRAVDLVRITATEPTHEMGVTRMPGVRHRREILGVAPGSAYVLRRAAPLGIDQAGKLFPQLRRETPLYLYGVAPIIAKVVRISNTAEPKG